MTKLHPKTKLETIVSDNKVELLCFNIVTVLQEAISLQGYSLKNYIDVLGKKGTYSDFAKVFNRESQNCIVCKSKILKLKVAGRGTYICSNCQILKVSR